MAQFWAVNGAERGMLSSLTEKLEGEGWREIWPRRTGGGKLRAMPPKGRMNLRRVRHRPMKVEVNRQLRWSAEMPQSAGRTALTSLRWNEATGKLGQPQLGLIKYNQNLKSWAAILGWSGLNRAHLCPMRGFNSCVKETHLVQMTEMYLSIISQYKHHEI